MSSILIFWGIGVKPIHPGPCMCVAHDHIPRHARYCAAINHSRAHKRILHPPQSYSRYVFSIDAEERDAKDWTKASSAHFFTLAYETSFSSTSSSFAPKDPSFPFFSPPPSLSLSLLFSFFLLSQSTLRRWHIRDNCRKRKLCLRGELKFNCKIFFVNLS